MPTTIGVQETTRNRLEQLKRALGAPSLDATVAALIVEHERRRAGQESTSRLHAILAKRPEIQRFAKEHGIRSIALYGSALRGDSKPESDVDLLIDFRPDRIPDFIRLSAMERELSALVGFTVDLQTHGSFRPEVRKGILAEALNFYESA